MDMLGSKRREGRFFPRFLACVALWAWQGTSVPAAAGQSGRRGAVELECKIVSSSPGFDYKSWIVEIRKSNGVPLRQVRKDVGETARFRDLEPGNYILCLTGINGNGRCESVDLNPPENRGHFRLKTKLGTPNPVINSTEGHRISVAQLLIPKEAQIELSRSDDAAVHGNMEKMYHHLERALQIFPNYPRALNNMGVYYYRLKNVASSIHYLQKATEVDPDFFPAWANLGSSMLATGGFKEATEVNKRALALRPNDARANSQLALSYFYLHEYSQARKYFEKELELDPLTAVAPHLFLAQIAIIENRHEEAVRYINDFLELHPNSPLAPTLRELLANARGGHLVSVPSLDRNVGR
jgi:tetratricopeptide (TPR) repeat protein